MWSVVFEPESRIVRVSDTNTYSTRVALKEYTSIVCLQVKDFFPKMSCAAVWCKNRKDLRIFTTDIGVRNKWIIFCDDFKHEFDNYRIISPLSVQNMSQTDFAQFHENA